MRGVPLDRPAISSWKDGRRMRTILPKDEPHDLAIAPDGATIAEAKAGASPEFLLLKREGAAKDPIHHAILRVSDIVATVAAAKGAGATVDRDVSTVSIGGAPIKIAMLVDPQGNALEIMELPKTLTHLPH